MKLTKATVTRICEWKLEDSILTLEIQISMTSFVVSEAGMEARLLAILEIMLVIILNLISLKA